MSLILLIVLLQVRSRRIYLQVTLKIHDLDQEPEAYNNQVRLPGAVGVVIVGHRRR